VQTTLTYSLLTGYSGGGLHSARFFARASKEIVEEGNWRVMPSL